MLEPRAREVEVRLDGQQTRRRHGLPTLTVLCGPSGATLLAWRAWLARAGRGLLVSAHDQTDSLIANLARASARTVLDQRAVLYVARLGRVPPDELRATLACKSAADRARFFENLERLDGGAGLELARSLLAMPADEGVLTPPVGAGALERFMRGLYEIAGPDLPGLLIERTHPPASIPDRMRLAAAAAWLAELVPELPIAVALRAGELEEMLRWAGENRTLAMMREGLIVVPSLERAEVQARLAATGAGDLGEAVACLVEDGIDDTLAEALVAAVTSPEQAEGDRARSASERFLALRVESLPETTGLFELNGRLERRFGPAAAEVDLLCRELRIAIEIDGYHHFRDADAYRRDRRKDLLLQHEGYLVLRFLAEDVVRRIHIILDDILHAVRARRQPVQPAAAENRAHS